jgi:cholinesterase
MLNQIRKALAAGIVCVALTATAASAHTWKTLYAFGDSYTDSGAGYAATHGPTSVVYLARSLGIPFTYYGDPADQGGVEGLNFAVSAATTGGGQGFWVRPVDRALGTKEAMFARGMKVQVQDFVRLVKTGTHHFDPQTTLFFLAGGLNDDAFTTAQTIDNLTSEVTTLYAAGGRYFMIAQQPTAVPAFHDTAARLNPALAKLPAALQARLPGAHVIESKWGQYIDDVMGKAKQFGFTNTTDKCVGQAIMGEDPKPCADPDAHFYYEIFHPSTKVHKIVAEGLVRDLKAFDG